MSRRVERKINVLQFICPSGLYGAEMWILALSKHLNPNAICCRLAVTRESDRQNLEIHTRFEALGLTSLQLSMRNRFDPFIIYKLVQLIKEKEIDIIHTHGYKSDILGLLSARIAGIKVIATPHGFENSKDIKLQAFIRLGCLVLKYCDYVAPLSEALQSDILRLGINPSNIQLIKNGVDLDEIDEGIDKGEEAPYCGDHEKRIGYVGQLVSRKNTGDLIKTFDAFHREHPDSRLIIIGDGPQRSLLEKEAQASAAASQIEFLGYRSDRIRLVKTLDLFCMTSSLEGVPRCMMEAMAMGIPVAAYNIPGVDQLIIHEKTGLMTDFGNRDGLKKCWERLLYDKTFSEKMAQSGRAHIIKNFSAHRMAEEYMALYRKILLEPEYKSGFDTK